MVKYVKGDLLDSNCDYICHQVNCQGVMGSGIAKQIRERWPRVYEGYKHFCEHVCEQGDRTHLLGNIFIAAPHDGKRVINMFGQLNCGYDGKRYTSYSAFAHALELIAENVPINKTIGFPKNIGCGLGGADWDCILALIEEILGKTHDVYIYELE